MTAVFVVLTAVAFPGASFREVKVILSADLRRPIKRSSQSSENSGIKVTTSNGASQGNALTRSGLSFGVASPQTL